MHEFAKQIGKRWRTYALWVLFWSVILVPLTATFIYISIHEGDNARPHVPELRKIADEIPLYPGAQKTSDRVIVKRNIALLTVFHRSNGSYSDVRSFYQRELAVRGWMPPKGPANRWINFDAHSADYQRGNYFIALERDGYSNNFSIAFMWEPQ